MVSPAASCVAVSVAAAVLVAVSVAASVAVLVAVPDASLVAVDVVVSSAGSSSSPPQAARKRAPVTASGTIAARPQRNFRLSNVYLPGLLARIDPACNVQTSGLPLSRGSMRASDLPLK